MGEYSSYFKKKCEENKILKILHTSDWHLGAKTERRSRIEEQKRVMQEIVRVADEQGVDVVLIAGDIYDQAICSSEAEDLFFNTIEQLSKNNNRVVIVVAGNHDDPKRLMANTHFAKKHKIVLVGNLHPVCEVTNTGSVNITRFGDCFVEVTVKKDEEAETAVFGILPYPTDYRLEHPINEAESYSQKVKEWAKISGSGFSKETFNVFVSHFNLVGARWQEGDNYKVYSQYDSGIVKKSDLPKANYYALGHIHSMQDLGGNFFYCGAPLQLDYSQKECGVNILNVKKKKLQDVQFVSLQSPVKMNKVCANGINEVAKELQYYSTEDIVELTICQNYPLTTEEIKFIKDKYPSVAQVRLMLTNIKQDDKIFVTNRDKLSNEELFESFYAHKTGNKPDEKLRELFVKLMEEVENETN